MKTHQEARGVARQVQRALLVELAAGVLSLPCQGLLLLVLLLLMRLVLGLLSQRQQCLQVVLRGCRG
jgi:hypothetical protein